MAQRYPPTLWTRECKRRASPEFCCISDAGMTGGKRMRLTKPSRLRDFNAGGARRTISATSDQIRSKTECPESIDDGGSPEPAPSVIETAAEVHEENSGANGAEPKSVASENLLSCSECSRTFRTRSAIRSDPVRVHKMFSAGMMPRRGKMMPCKQ